MSNFINKYPSIIEYNADESKEYPNVSYLEVEDEVKWQATEPIDQEHIVAKYNVTDTSNPTKVLNNINNITKMIVDGVEQQSVVTGYTFSTTGEHKVKYKVNSVWNEAYVFNNCTSLTSITFPDTITRINAGVAQNCSGLMNVILPSGITSIEIYTFKNCSSLTSVTIPDSVTSLGIQSFNGCSSLTGVVISDSVTTIGDNAFQNCSGLTTVSIGSGVTSIGGSAFWKCYGLASITVEATTPPTLGGAVFGGTFPIYVPAESVNAYKAAANWSTYASRIQAIQ